MLLSETVICQSIVELTSLQSVYIKKADSLGLEIKKLEELELSNIQLQSIDTTFQIVSCKIIPVYTLDFKKKLGDIQKGDTINVTGYDGGNFIIGYKSDIGKVHKNYVLEDRNVSRLIYEEELKEKKELDKIAKIQKSELEEKQKAKEKLWMERQATRKSNLITKYGQEDGNRIFKGKAWIGMSSEMARESWGSPEDINKTINAYGVKEQWVYGSGSYLYFENGKLTTIQN